jgi:hypothetical protein
MLIGPYQSQFSGAMLNRLSVRRYIEITAFFVLIDQIDAKETKSKLNP